PRSTNLNPQPNFRIKRPPSGPLTPGKERRHSHAAAYPDRSTDMSSRTMNPVRAVMAALVLAGSPTFSMSEPGPSRGAAIPGSYEFRVCSGPCSFTDRTNVLAGGTLVLDGEAINPEVIPKQLRSRYRSADAQQGPPNGCFM